MDINFFFLKGCFVVSSCVVFVVGGDVLSTLVVPARDMILPPPPLPVPLYFHSTSTSTSTSTSIPVTADFVGRTGRNDGMEGMGGKGCSYVCNCRRRTPYAAPCVNNQSSWMFLVGNQKSLVTTSIWCASMVYGFELCSSDGE